MKAICDHKISCYILLIICALFSVSCRVHHDVTRVMHKVNDHGVSIRITYYNDKEKVATETYDMQFKLLQREGIIPDGLIKEYYGNGIKAGEFNYKNNVLNGLSTSYYENGKKMSEFNWKDNRLDGISRIYDKDGIVFREIEYKSDKKCGYYKQYFKNHRIKILNNYKNDELEGISRIFNENGGIKEEKEYKGGKIVILRKYSEKGELL